MASARFANRSLVNARIALVFALLVCSCAAVAAERLHGRVVAVTDGHTLTVLLGSRRVQVQLAHVDSPVGTQRHAIGSRQSLIALCGGEPVELRVHHERADGSMVASAGCNGKDAGAEQLRRGMAIIDAKSGAADARLSMLEHEARAARRGVWADARAWRPSESR